jgi:FKBP-type peptidyl-prolyl cis-trans isomerase SlyD
MLLVNKDMVVSVHYELKVDNNGELVTADKSNPEQPLVYIQGAGMLLADFETNLAGKTVGDTVSFKVAAENGYGLRNEQDIVSVPADSFKRPRWQLRYQRYKSWKCIAYDGRPRSSVSRYRL